MKYAIMSSMRIIIFLFAIIIISSCSSPFPLNIKNYIVKHTQLDEAWLKASQYKYIPDIKEYIKSPLEFEKDGGGDCEDFAAYLVYLLGPDASMLYISIKNGTEVHAMVKYNEQYIEPQDVYSYYDENNIDIIIEMDYFEVMEKSTKYGTRRAQ